MSSTNSSKNITLNLKQKQKHKRKRKRSQIIKSNGLLDVIYSWSLSDIINKNLYKFKVKEVPLTFPSETDYLNLFTSLLLEETRAELHSQVTGIRNAPTSRVSEFRMSVSDVPGERSYNATLTNMSSYSPKGGDLIVLATLKPRCIDDLYRPNSPFLIAFVNRVVTRYPLKVQITSSKRIDLHPIVTSKSSDAFVVYLTNLTTNMRIWQALKPSGNTSIIQRTLSFRPPEYARNTDLGCSDGEKGVVDSNLRETFDSFKLNSSQEAAVFTCLASNKGAHQEGINLIWGPPGTGKTKTVASLLFLLLRTNHRTLTCAPTNIAVVGVVKRLLSLVRDHDLGYDAYGLGDIILFGNEGRMEINEDHKDVHDVFLDHRIDTLLECLSLWKVSTNDMICFLESKTGVKSTSNKNYTFRDLRDKLISCYRSLYAHLPTSVLSLNYVKKIYHIIYLLEKVDEKMVTTNKLQSEASVMITDCLQPLKDLQASFRIPISRNRAEVESFCLRNACLIFCTASSSIKVCRPGMTSIEFVLIDEAAQLKECESIIPFKLSGVRHAVLVGDERQLSAMVQSKICEEAKFGRSLFERLVLLGHEKHLLNIQYRMHPTISLFPNTEFYEGKLVDAPDVNETSRERCFLEGGMYGSYSFINVDLAKEEIDKNNSTKNMLEVAVITEIVANLFRESVAKKQKVTVGCLSPYKAQVNAIEEKLCKYIHEAKGSCFSLKVRSIDSFQGSEEDVIIFSTVRCNYDGSVGFLASRERANVGLTRARHCLWIVGNKATMIKSSSVWKKLVLDAENRGCLYDASDDMNLANAMVHTLFELGHFGSLLKSDSILFKEAKWKVNFTNMFFERLSSISNLDVRKLVVNLLVKLSSGWRELGDNSSSKFFEKQGICNILEAYGVDEQLYLIWSVDLAYENSLCTQVLIFWDILPLSQIQQRALCLARVYWNYTADTINRCLTKRFERNRVLPVTWPIDSAHAVSD
ncbi:putative P-loop containing nucleoside triphosphate hydrolase [Tanacetum coccineum]